MFAKEIKNNQINKDCLDLLVLADEDSLSTNFKHL